MRILIHGINFAPELVGTGKLTGEMAEWLAAKGHQVRVVTAPPFNPTPKVFSGFSGWCYQREERTYFQQIGKVGDETTSNNSQSRTGRGSPASLPTSDVAPGQLSILRCPLWVPRTASGSKRIAHLASFAFSSLWVMLSQIHWRPDVVMVIEPTLFCAPAAWLTARMSGAKSWFHVQDFEVDAAFELRLLTSPMLKQVVSRVEAGCMRSFGRVSTISTRMLERLHTKGVESGQCILFPNWVDTQVIFPLPHVSPLRREWGFDGEKVVVHYSGTMANKQGLEVLADAAQRLQQREDIQFIFCGEGSGKAALHARTAAMSNVRWLPLQPVDRLNDLFNLADIHLLPQRANAADLLMPSKLTGMLASGRPVIAGAVAGTQLAEAVHGRGIAVQPENPVALAEAIGRLADSPGLRRVLGSNARAYAVAECDKRTVLERFEQDLHNFISDKSLRQGFRDETRVVA